VLARPAGAGRVTRCLQPRPKRDRDAPLQIPDPEEYLVLVLVFAATAPILDRPPIENAAVSSLIFDPGCAKTRAFNLLVESSSQFGQSEN